VDDLQELSTDPGLGFGQGRLLAPLAQVAAGPVEYDDPAVAVPVGDVDIPLSGSTATSAGRFSRVRLLLVGVPVIVPSEESKRPFSPICSSSVRRSWLYFWTMASALPAIHTLS
jgi:hypothetical protein